MSEKVVVNAFEAAREALEAFQADRENLVRIDALAAALVACFRAGGKVLAVGNGGSACDAAHFCEELTGRFRAPPPGLADRPPLPALACTDAGHITCTANDYGYDEVFARWVRALARKGDVVVLLSTSGNSQNVVRAAAAAREAGAATVALLGKGGGTLRGTCDFEWIAPGQTADRIQEIHMLLLHVLIEAVEARLRGE
jgi:D-sedoheptulose 7-phosphate isomerase